jgi:hypothetical protein
VSFAASEAGLEDDPSRQAIAARLDGLATTTVPQLLDWAAEYRGARATVVDGVQELLETGSGWLRNRVVSGVNDADPDVVANLDAFRTLNDCRKTLAQRNANPQMVAERALLALRETIAR